MILTPEVTLAAIGLFTLGGTIYQSRQLRKAKEDDNKRQDALLAHQEKAAAELAAKTEEVARLAKQTAQGAANAALMADQKLDAVADEARRAAAIADEKANTIHGLVNNAFSEEIKTTLDAFELLLVVLEKFTGAAVTREISQLIIETREKIVAKKAILSDRDKQADATAKELDAAKAKGPLHGQTPPPPPPKT